MDKVLIKEYKNRFWDVAEIFKNDKKIATVNLFFSVKDDWIFIYNTAGGSGYGYKQGDLIEKIYIGDCELERISVKE